MRSGQPSSSTLAQILLSSFQDTLKSRELNDQEHNLVRENLTTPETLESLMLIAAAHLRTGTLNLLASLNASSENIKQWITGQKFKAITTIPTFDQQFNLAIAIDNADYLEFLAAISPDIRSIIIDKLIALPQQTKLTLTQSKIKQRFIALNQDIDQIIEILDVNNRFAHAIVNGDLAYIRSHSCNFDQERKDYFIVLAASHQQTAVLRELIENKKFSTQAISDWIDGCVESSTAYRYPYPISKDGCKNTLIKAVGSGNLAFLQLMKPFLSRKLDESLQLDLTLVATAADNVEMLAFLTKDIACVLEPREYSWKKEHSHTTTWTDSDVGSMCARPAVIREETTYDDAERDIAYRSTLLAAANHEKLKALAWLLHRPFKHKEDDIKRCHEMAKTRPSLKEFFTVRQKNISSNIASLDDAEVRIYLSSLKTFDEFIDVFVAACKSERKQLISDILRMPSPEVSIFDRDQFSFSSWLAKKIKNDISSGNLDPRVIPLLDGLRSIGTTFELGDALKALRIESEKLSKIADIAFKISQPSLSASQDELQWLIQALRSSKNAGNLAQPILESILKNDNLSLFYTLFLPSNEDDVRTFAPYYSGNASTCLIQAVKADALQIFEAVHAAFGNNALDKKTRAAIRAVRGEFEPARPATDMRFFSVPGVEGELHKVVAKRKSQ